MSRPIGVFDSGVGGLTVLKELRHSLPSQDFIYFSDTARVPYGRKPKEMVREFATEIAEFLQQLDVAGIVIACNTASSVALPEMSHSMSIPVWGVIDPGVEAARRATRTGHVGVIGTKGTIASEVYQQKLAQAGMQVWARACPLFVHLVEEGLADSGDAVALARHYLGDAPAIDTLILGCTHYPVLKPVIQDVLGPTVTLVSSAEVTAEVVAAASPRHSSGVAGKVTHYVTGGVHAYMHTAEAIGGVEGQVIPVDVNRLSGARLTVGPGRM
ncbi:MAG TPA: glutamate racemase [Bryobacteraceae bacterium]|nr:glutamate racemase [Bryobacteraceae bacterium]